MTVPNIKRQNIISKYNYIYSLHWKKNTRSKVNELIKDSITCMYYYHVEQLLTVDT